MAHNVTVSETQDFAAEAALSNYPRVSEVLTIAHGPSLSMLGQGWKLLAPKSGRWVGGMFIAALLATTSALLAASAIYYFIATPILQSGDALVYSFGLQISAFFNVVAIIGGIAGFKLFLVPQQLQAVKFLRDRTLSKTGVFDFGGNFIAVLTTTFAVTFMVCFGLLLGIIPGIYLLGRYGLAPLIAADQKLCLSKSMALSAEKSRENVWTAGLTLTLSGILGVLGTFVAGIGGLYSASNHALTMSLIYRATFPEQFPEDRIKLHESVAITDTVPTLQEPKKRWLSNKSQT